jgi:hypothetical protein
MLLNLPFARHAALAGEALPVSAAAASSSLLAGFSPWSDPNAGAVHEASYLQPPMASGMDPADIARQPVPRAAPATRAPQTPTGATWRSQSVSRRPATRLASVPKMFGDFGPAGGRLRVFNQSQPNQMITTDLASAGVGQRLKVLENNNAWPDDRIDFLYRHYHNSIRSTPQRSSPNVDEFSTDSYTFSFERSFFDGLTSVQVLMPFVGTPTLRSNDATLPNNFVDGGNVGNPGVILKGLLLSSDSFAVSGGLGINVPLGSDVNGRVLDTAFHIENESFQLGPWGAFLWSPEGPWLSNFFVQGGVQYDIVIGGNTVTGANPSAGFQGQLMKIADSDILFSDLVFGAFLYENPAAGILNGITGQVEVHHAWSTDPKFAAGVAGADVFVFGTATDRVDALNITGGLRFMLFGNTVLSAGAVAPLHGRLFDAEIHALASIFL